MLSKYYSPYYTILLWRIIRIWGEQIKRHKLLVLSPPFYTTVSISSIVFTSTYLMSLWCTECVLPKFICWNHNPQCDDTVEWMKKTSTKIGVCRFVGGALMPAMHGHFLQIGKDTCLHLTEKGLPTLLSNREETSELHPKTAQPIRR